MSTEVQPPSPDRSSSRFHKGKHSASPPVAFSPRSARRGHIRSSSFGGFVSHLLPSRRQERGHTLRSELNDEDARDSVGLVFSLPNSQDWNNLPRRKDIDKTGERKARSCSPRKNSGPSNAPRALSTLDSDQPHRVYDQLEQAGRFSDRDPVGVLGRARRTGGDGIGIGPKASDKGKVSTLRRIFGSIKIARGEKRSESKYPEPFCPRPPQILESKEAHLETPDIFSDEKEITKTQQMFDNKRFRREQRRSLRKSGDFLGVQGANPRTGYWDISDATSSSEPSQMSEKTKLKLDQQARELAEQKRKYNEARESHQRELMRAQTLKDLKKKEKGEQKKVELKLRQRRRGKWKLSEGGWSSVAEPELSPIQQSLAGSPVAELAPGDRLFPMPCAAEPTPYIIDTPTNQADYFSHQVVFPPREQLDQATDASFFTPRSSTIPRKPVGSPSRQRIEESSDTIVHNNILMNLVRVQPSSPHRAQQTSAPVDPALTTLEHGMYPTPSEQQHRFLGEGTLSSELADPSERKATAISFRSVSTKQVAIRPPLAQSPIVQRIISLDELPPVSLKDPISARIPSSYQIPIGPLPIWARPTITKTELDKPTSSINTSTIITTGLARLQYLPGQLDGASDVRSGNPSRQQLLQHKSSQIHLRTSSHQRSRQRDRHGILSQTHPAGIVISSEHQLNLTKQRSIKLCQMSSPEGDRTELKSTPISISTSRQSPEKQKEVGQKAALLAFQQLRRQMAMKKAEGPVGGQLTPPKIRKQKIEDTRDTNARGDTGDPSKTKRGPGKGSTAPQTSPSPIAAAAGAVAATSKARPSDKLVVWHAERSAEKKAGGSETVTVTGAHPTPTATATATAIVVHQHQKRRVSPAKGVPRPGRRTRSIGRVVVGIAQSAWLVVEPVFDPNSDVRKRFERQRLTGQDVGLFVAAAVLILLAMVAFARVWGTGLQAARAFGAVFRFLAGW